MSRWRWQSAQIDYQKRQRTTKTDQLTDGMTTPIHPIPNSNV
ncbi:hypothetical protein [Nostoc sp. C052]|nr:hypothetical protein [Nostoc sp. C052]